MLILVKQQDVSYFVRKQIGTQSLSLGKMVACVSRENVQEKKLLNSIREAERKHCTLIKLLSLLW